jgi:DNA-binding beta-propeller fold protein YncE/cytochrome c peroxidase
MQRIQNKPRFLRPWHLGIALSLGAACGGDDGGDADVDAGDGVDAPDAPVAVSRRASKSGTIAITNDDSRVLMVNPETDTVSLFDTATDTRIVELAVGGEPSSVVIHPGDDIAFVANRADATVVKITGLKSGSPQVGTPLPVGSEPAGLALSPTGARLYVAEFAEGRIAVVDTSNMTEVGQIAAPRNPRALAVTNDGDEDDTDELIIVPEFFGEAGPGEEATDTSRAGRVRIYQASDLAGTQAITLAAIDSGFAPSTAAPGAPTVMTSPNQLFSVLVNGSKLYLTSISASPAAPTNFQTNVQPVVYVASLDGRVEDRGALGTANLARLLRDQAPDPAVKFFLADIVDIGFVGGEIAYVLSRGADVVQRVSYTGAGPTLGSQFNKQIDLNLTPAGSPGPCQNPTGIAVTHAGARAYVNCWGTRRLGVVDFSTQTLARTVESAAISTAERAEQDGRHFFFTGRGRWSKDAWSSCGSCHPDGLSDNITWVFAAGPRQSTSMDGSYSHGAGAQKQRVFNWTGIFDEMHDFERNTRDVQGGKGALTVPDPNLVGAACGTLAQETPIVITAAGLGRAVKFDMENTTGSCTDDWNDIDAYAKTVRPPGKLRKLDAASVARGATLFGEPTAQANNAACVRCHGGAGWTASRRAFTPVGQPAGNAGTDLQPFATTAFAPPAFWPPASSAAGWNFHTQTLAAQPASSFFTAPEQTTALAPGQIACVLRNVGSFGSDELERRIVNGAVARAQGRLGFNVPSLYGMALGAPYFHHGKVDSLEELFDDAAWAAHATAGNPVWLSAGTPAEIAQRKVDLINFVLSIDASTTEQPIPVGWDGCP